MGTIAADPAVYPFGTRMAVPGYGVGTVRDIGGAIKGAHIDIWFPSHEAAIAWGSRKIKVKVAKADGLSEAPPPAMEGGGRFAADLPRRGRRLQSNQGTSNHRTE